MDCQKITLERHIQGAGFPGSSTKDNTMSSFRLQMCPFPNLGGRLENRPRVSQGQTAIPTPWPPTCPSFEELRAAAPSYGERDKWRSVAAVGHTHPALCGSSLEGLISLGLCLPTSQVLLPPSRPPFLQAASAFDQCPVPSCIPFCIGHCRRVYAATSLEGRGHRGPHMPYTSHQQHPPFPQDGPCSCVGVARGLVARGPSAEAIKWPALESAS